MAKINRHAHEPKPRSPRVHAYYLSDREVEKWLARIAVICAIRREREQLAYSRKTYPAQAA